MRPQVIVTNTNPEPVEPKIALLSGFTQYVYAKTGIQVSDVLVGDWTPTDGDSWTVQCVSSSIVKIDRSGGYMSFVLLLRSIKLNDGQPTDSVFNTIFESLLNDGVIESSGHRFAYVDGSFNSPVRVSGGVGIDGYYDSGLLETENALTTSAVLTFYAYE